MNSPDHLKTDGVSRRVLLRFMVGAAAITAAGPMSQRTGVAAEPRTYRTTTTLSLRAGPRTGYRVLLVMPAGALALDYDGVLAHGFRSVDYQGTVGWAYDAYLQLVEPPQEPEIIGTAQTTTNVNLRAGPGTGYAVLRVVPAGTWVKISDTMQNGFRYVIDNGKAGWIYDAYLGDSTAGAFTTTTALNLRAGPGTTYKVLTVMPAGATVVDYDGVLSNGFRSVDYRGTVGWAYNAYLV